MATVIRAMSTLDLIVQPSVDPALGAAIDGWLMSEIAGTSERGVLRVHALARDAVSLGRYHLAPHPRQNGPSLARRHSGGRAWPHGEGFVGVSLVLPHRSALVSDDPLALAPHQVPNRCVRAVLEVCRAMGIDAFYPGRDLIKAGGRVIGALAFEVDARGVLLFEAVVSLERTFSCLAALLDAADPEGEVVAHLWSEEETTSLAREGRPGVGVEEFADLLHAAFEEKFDLTVRRASLAGAAERRIGELAEAEYGGALWLGGRRRRGGLEKRIASATQLGAFEAIVGLGTDGRIADLAFVGDFIANSPAIDSLERRLRSQSLERSSIEPVVNEVFADPRNFILGVGKTTAIADLLLRAEPK